MGRRGISYEKKLEAVEKYQRGEGSQSSIARQYGVDRTSFNQWLAIYEAMGPSGLAAVVKPFIEPFVLKIVPAPKKPMPLMTWAPSLP